MAGRLTGKAMMSQKTWQRRAGSTETSAGRRGWLSGQDVIHCPVTSPGSTERHEELRKGTENKAAGWVWLPVLTGVEGTTESSASVTSLYLLTAGAMTDSVQVASKSIVFRNYRCITSTLQGYSEGMHICNELPPFSRRRYWGGK